MQCYPNLTFAISQNLPIIRSLLSVFSSGVSCLKELYSDCSRDVRGVHLLARLVLTGGIGKVLFITLASSAGKCRGSQHPQLPVSRVASLAAWQFSDWCLDGFAVLFSGFSPLFEEKASYSRSGVPTH